MRRLAAALICATLLAGAAPVAIAADAPRIESRATAPKTDTPLLAPAPTDQAVAVPRVGSVPTSPVQAPSFWSPQRWWGNLLGIIFGQDRPGWTWQQQGDQDDP